jgi:hypothetical protein
MLFTCAFASCSHDDEIIREAPIYDLYVGEMFSADAIVSLGLYNRKENGMPEVPDYVYKSYMSFSLHAEFRLTDVYGTYYCDSSLSVIEGIHDLEKDYWNEKTEFFQEAYKEQAYDSPLFWPHLFTAYVDDGTTITCDKKLFNKEPGEDLSQYFRAYGASYCQPMGRENPYLLFGFSEERTMNMTDYFRKDAWLQRDYILSFREEPQEKYDELTFTLTVPLERELVIESMANRYFGKGDAIVTSNDVYTGTCTLHFDFPESE